MSVYDLLTHDQRIQRQYSPFVLPDIEEDDDSTTADESSSVDRNRYYIWLQLRLW
jgi:hypothetical protein